MIYSGAKRGPFKNKQARADFIQESFQSITGNKGYLSMGFVRQQLCCLTLGRTKSEPEFRGTSMVWEMKDTRITSLYATS